jgi:hypothetical protein
MKLLLLTAILTLNTGAFAFAGELDNESSITNQSMNGTVVIRVDSRSNKTSVLSSQQVVANDSEAKALVQEGSFKEVPAANLKKELDQDGGASSWYFYGGYSPYYSYNMYWYGSWYTPCYSYNYNYYNYYYYSYYRW